MPGDDAVDAVSNRFKLPPFWESNIPLWFIRIEAQFNACKFTSEKAKFNALVAELDERIMTEVSDVIITPIANTEYTSLKEEIIKRFQGSEDKRILSVIHNMQLADATPSQLYRKMETTAGSAVNAVTLKTIWMQRLPSRIQSIIAGNDTANVDIKVLTAMADRIAVYHQPQDMATASVHAVQDPISKLIARIDALETRLSLQSRGRSDARQHGSRDRSDSRSGLCFYHRRFQAKAKKCEQPCSWSNRTSTSSSENYHSPN